MKLIDLSIPENHDALVSDHTVKVRTALHGWRYIAFHGGYTRDNQPVPMTLNEARRLAADWGGKVVNLP